MGDLVRYFHKFMKTAKEWVSVILAKYGIVRNGMADVIKEIQLDAMKEGMKRAAKIAWDAEAHITYDRPVDERHCRAILISLEQLTEKDFSNE